MSGKTWKETATERRDARADSSQPADQRIRKRKPNRKKWCKGKVGVEHKPVCRDYAEVKVTPNNRVRMGSAYYEGWKILVCTECGKELSIWMPWWNKTNEEPPEWARETSK